MVTDSMPRAANPFPSSFSEASLFNSFRPGSRTHSLLPEPLSLLRPQAPQPAFIDPARLLATPMAAAGGLALAVSRGNSGNSIAMALAQVNQKKIMDLQERNDSMKTQKDTEAVRGYVTAVGRDVVVGALVAGVYWGETAAVIGAVVGVGVGAVPAAGFGVTGGAIIGGVGALSASAVGRGIELQSTLEINKTNWYANYRSIQNYSNINCAGAPPEVRY